MPSVTAKPRTGPVPMKNSTAAAMNVVMLESRIVRSALVKPASSAVIARAARPHLLADALVDQHVGVHRDADGQHDAGDAGQGQRRLQEREQAEDHADVDGDRDIGEQAEQAVGREHEDDHQDRAQVGRVDAGGDRVLAEAGADGALLDDGQRRRQRAGAEQDRQVVGLLDREIAADLAGAAGDRLADHRRRDHLVVEHDGERPADVLQRRRAEAAGAGIVEAEGDDRLARALVEAGLGVDQVLAGDDDALLDQIWLTFVLGGGSTSESAGGRLRAPVLRRHRHIDQAEGELGGLADQLLEARRVLQTRHLHQHAVGALALDRRLDGAELVDAAAHDLDRLIDRLADALGDRRPG